MLAYARALGVTYYAQNYAGIIRQPLLDRAPAVLNNTLFLTLALNEKYLLYACINAEQQQGEGCGLDFFQSVKGF